MKQSTAIANFRQLCCLGLDAQTIIPAALQALHGLIGSADNAFFWSTQSGDITNVYLENPMAPDIEALYFREFLNNRQRPDSTVQIRKLLAPGEIVGNSARLFPREFYGSDVYNLIWRPLRRQSVLWARVRDTSGTSHGIALHRVAGDPPFSRRDEMLLAQLVPYLEQAVEARGNLNGQYVASGESGLIILDDQGKVCYQSARGRRLMLLAAHPRIAPDSVDWSRDTVLPGALKRLREGMDQVFSGAGGPPPVMQQQNAWGKFVFRAYELEHGQRAGRALVGVSVERHVPLKLRLVQSMQSLPLSAKQQQVCLLLAEGRSYADIAAQLSVSPNTVVDHVRKIYTKLDVHGHDELLDKLRQEGDPSAGARSGRIHLSYSLARSSSLPQL